jgi:type I restriction enzyme S subunit
MHQLFTRGLWGEEQKETEYGPIPMSWRTIPLGGSCSVQGGVTKGRTIDPNEALEVPYLRVANVQDGRLDLTDIKRIVIRRAELQRYLLRDKDVLLTEGGDLDKLGRGFIWRGQIPNCVHQNHIFAVRPDPNVVLPEYLAYLVQSPYGKAYFLTVAHKTTNLATINSTKLKAFPILAPPLDEQREIVSALEAIDNSLTLHERKRSALTDLFNTLLQDLMSGRVRVKAKAGAA